MGGQLRWLGLAGALCVLSCAGCIKINVDVAVAPDQSTDARLAVGLASSLAEMASGESGVAFKELQDAPGQHWTVREYKEDSWDMTEATGHAGPGELLFPAEEGAPKLQVQLSPRRLSTRYQIALTTPMPATPPAAAPPAPAAGEEGPDMSGFATAMLGDMTVHLSLSGPGEVVATTGEVGGPGKAVWALPLTELQEKKTLPDFRLTTELPNWDTIGKLASQLVMRGGPTDAGSRLASALQRGLLPNPPLSAAPAEKLSAVDYLRLLEVIGKLDAGAGPAITDVIVKQNRLNDEAVSGAKIAALHAKIMKLDVGTIVEQSMIKALSVAVD